MGRPIFPNPRKAIFWKLGEEEEKLLWRVVVEDLMEDRNNGSMVGWRRQIPSDR